MPCRCEGYETTSEQEANDLREEKEQLEEELCSLRALVTRLSKYVDEEEMEREGRDVKERVALAKEGLKQHKKKEELKGKQREVEASEKEVKRKKWQAKEARDEAKEIQEEIESIEEKIESIEEGDVL